MNLACSKSRKLFVTTALPYANGKLHLGHLLEYIQADVWVRAQRMQGHSVQFVCADDAHGAPIMIAAEAAAMTPEAYVRSVVADRSRYLDGFLIRFDNWHSTHSPENVELAQETFKTLRSNGMIESREIEQYFDAVKEMFLPDRYIKGECPSCHAKEQYGDACEICGSVYQATELIEPRSVLTGSTPVLRVSEHFFFKLSDSRVSSFLKEWIAGGPLQAEMAKKTSEWFDKGLADWDVSRDAPYFGIPMPDVPDKFFYVWLDAPIGYLASLKNHFDKGQAKCHWHPPSRTPQSFEEFMSDADLEQVHFIGKDIVYFHALFWPAVLQFSGRKAPCAIYVHGHLTVNGDKMSKSRGNGIDPLKYLELGMNPEWMRYYMAAKLSARVEDADFNSKDFSQRVNADLVGKFINIGSRSAGFIAKSFGGLLGSVEGDGAALVATLQKFTMTAFELFDQREFGKCIREIMLQADRVNEYFDRHAPWELKKQEAKQAELHQVCTASIEAFRLLTICLKPILPALAENIEQFLRIEPLVTEDAQRILGAGHRINEYRHLISRVDPQAIDAAFDGAVSRGNGQGNRAPNMDAEAL
jgi:methionyl-tRNA synthetase